MNKEIKSKEHHTIFKDDEAQLLVLTGVTICVLIIVSYGAIISMSSINVPLDKSSFIKSEFDNVRTEFGLVLHDQLHGKMNDIDFVRMCFNHTRDLFAFAEAQHNNYFNAEFINVTYTMDTPDGIVAIITLSNDFNIVRDQVFYHIG